MGGGANEARRCAFRIHSGGNGHRTTDRKKAKTIWRFLSGAPKMSIRDRGGAYPQLADSTAQIDRYFRRQVMEGGAYALGGGLSCV
jgi:hypothetical protein